ncbi:MAG: hypothetical protein ACLPX5_08405 [Dissulfurispiraceae bacterium]
MIKKICYYIIVVSFMLISPSLRAADQKIYTDEDLKKYQSPSQQQAPPQEMPSGSVKTHSEYHGTETISVVKDKEYYCKEAKKHQRAIDKARRDLDAWNTTSPRDRRWYKFDQAEAQNRVDSAQQEYDDFIDEANRAGVPPGWLRCQ